MFKKLQVKICGLTREEDVDLVCSLGADFFGFIHYAKSPRGLSLARALRLASRVPEGKRVLVTVDPEVELLEQAKHAGFDFFQIHTAVNTSQALISEWSQAVSAERLCLAPRISPQDTFPEHSLDFCESYLIDTFSKDQIGGTGKLGDFKRFARFRQHYPQKSFILAGGLNAENILSAIKDSGAEHVDVSSGVEVSPGIKDADKLYQLFKLVKPS